MDHRVVAGVCNRAQVRGEPETLFKKFGAKRITPRPMHNRFNPVELSPRSRGYVVREEKGERGIDVMSWDVLGGPAKWPMTNVRQLGLPPCSLAQKSLTVPASSGVSGLC